VNYSMSLSALLMAATCCSLVMCYLSWKRREFPIAITYGLGMLAGSFYTFGYAFEITSTTLEQIRYWLRIEYMGIPFGSTIWIIMVLQYTGRQALIRKPMVVLLMIVPVLTLVAHYTNEWHHLYYRSITIDLSAGFPLAHLVIGPMYIVHIVYSYIFFIIGMGLMIQMYRKETPHMKKQIGFMMIGSLGPFGFPIIHLSGVLKLPIDISPFGFIFSGIFFMWGIYQFNMLRLAPLALEKVFESMQDAVIVIDLDKRITSFNRSASQLFESLHNKRVLGQPAADIFSRYPDVLDTFMQAAPSSYKFKISGTSKSQDRTYNAHLTMINDRKLKQVGKMLMLSDITDTVLYEEKLRDNASQLAELNSFKDKMFKVVAHDIRDPLALLINLMEIMEEDLQTDGQIHNEIVQEMGRQVNNTFTLVEGLLDWFNSQKGGMVFNPVIRDLAHTVQTNVQLMQVRSDSKNISILTDISKDLYVYADKEMLDLIIRNLLSNAIKFTPLGGSIRLNAIHANGEIIVSISDSGAGISAEQADSLLREDYLVSSLGTAGERGVGLGLTLCREFVRLNGGRIWFESTPTYGTTFYFSLPASS